MAVYTCILHNCNGSYTELACKTWFVQQVYLWKCRYYDRATFKEVLVRRSGVSRALGK